MHPRAARVVAGLSAAYLARPVIDPDITNGFDHRQMQVALGLAVVTVGAVATAALGGRVPGWRIPVWTLAAGVAAVGAASVTHPHQPGSAGSTLGWAALAGRRCCSSSPRPGPGAPPRRPRGRADARLRPADRPALGSAAPWVSRSPRACWPATSRTSPTRRSGSPTPTGCTST